MKCSSNVAAFCRDRQVNVVNFVFCWLLTLVSDLLAADQSSKKDEFGAADDVREAAIRYLAHKAVVDSIGMTNKNIKVIFWVPKE